MGQRAKIAGGSRFALATVGASWHRRRETALLADAGLARGRLEDFGLTQPRLWDPPRLLARPPAQVLGRVDGARAVTIGRWLRAKNPHEEPDAGWPFVLVSGPDPVHPFELHPAAAASRPGWIRRAADGEVGHHLLYPREPANGLDPAARAAVDSDEVRHALADHPAASVGAEGTTVWVDARSHGAVMALDLVATAERILAAVTSGARRP